MIRQKYFITLLILILTLSSALLGQNVSNSVHAKTSNDYVSAAQAIYWKALTWDEKQTFLFAYLASAHETQVVANKMIATSKMKKYEFNQHIDGLFSIWQDILEFQEENGTRLQEFIGWIDLFYSIELNASQPFSNAIMYSHKKVMAHDTSLLELFLGETMDKAIEKYNNKAQSNIKRKVATKDAYDFLALSQTLKDSLTEAHTSNNTMPKQIPLNNNEDRVISLAVEVECIHHSNPENLEDPLFLETLANKHGFDSIDDFNQSLEIMQVDQDRWKFLNQIIIERSFDNNCL